MNRTLLLGALFAIGTNAVAHDINPKDVSQRTVAECIEARLSNGENVAHVIASMREKIHELFNNNEISEQTANACLECVKTYEYDRILRHQEDAE